MNADASTEFAAWREAMGFDGKGSVKAGSMIGVPKKRAINLHTGRVAVPGLTERMAMAAARAGLPPWEPSLDSAIALAGALIAGTAGADELRTLRDLTTRARIRALTGE